MNRTITPQELENSYHYKVVKKILKREFPWIKDITFDPEELNKTRGIYLDFDIDPQLLSKTYNFELKGPILTAIRNDKEYDALFLSMFGDLDAEDSNDITNKIIHIANSVGDSKAFPNELKIHGDRDFGVHKWYYNKGKEHWF